MSTEYQDNFNFKENRADYNKVYFGPRWTRPNTMRLPANSKKKRYYKSEEVNNDVISDNPGLRSPKASPRRTPKKRKNRNAEKTQKQSHNPFNPTCRQLLPLHDHDHNETTKKDDSISDIKEDLTTKKEEDKVKTETEKGEEKYVTVTLVEALNQGTDDVTDRIYNNSSDVTAVLPVVEMAKVDPEADEGYNSSFIEIEKHDLDSSFTADITAAVHSSPYNSDTERERGEREERGEGVQLTEKELREIDEVLKEIEAQEQQKAYNSERVTEITDLNAEFIKKLTISVAKPTSVTLGIQTEPETKRRKLSKACQITDEAVTTLNKKLLNLRNKMNKKMMENERTTSENDQLKRKCSNLDMERLSLLAQTEALQTECVRKMDDNDKLNVKLDKRECHIQTLKETLLMRDKEINTFHKQLKSGVPQQLTDYRELEMLRVDNIRLLHDNRHLTASLDSLNGQLCVLRRISKNYDDCSDSVILMNKRLAEDNNILTCNLNSVKRELRNLNQEHEETREELRYIRGSYKRTLAERDELKKQIASPGEMLRHDNEALATQNNSLKQTAALLSEQIQSLHEELSAVRNNQDVALRDLDIMSDDRNHLQNQVLKLQDDNSALWARVGELRQQASEQTDVRNQQNCENKILSSENEELRKANDSMQDKADHLKCQLNSEIAKNAVLAAQIMELNLSLSNSSLTVQELKGTMEFLQVEHSFIESDVEKKDVTISQLQDRLNMTQSSREDLISKCKLKLKEKNKKLNASRIKLGYALMELRNLNSHGSESSLSSS